MIVWERISHFLPWTSLTSSIIGELLKTFVLSLLVMGLVIIGVLLGEANRNYDLGLVACLRLIPFVLPRAMAYAVSGAWLLAICSTYGSLASSNQLLAIRSMGISPLRPMQPAILLSAILVLPTIWMMDVGNSWGKIGIQKVVIESAAEIAYSSLRTKRSYVNEYLAISVKDVRDKRLIKLAVSFTPPDSHRLTAVAEEGEFQCDFEKRQVYLKLYNGTVTNDNGYSLAFPDDFSIQFSFGKAETPIGENVPLRELPAAIAKQEYLVALLRRQQNDRMLTLTSTEAAAPSPHVEESAKRLSHETFRLFRLKCYSHRRVSQGFCCLSFAIFGLPLTVLLRSKDLATSFFLCFAPIMLFFYAMEFRLARMSELPPYTLWLCHVILILGGVCVLRKVWKH